MKLLIFDLDDTIFETKSIGPHHVAPVFDAFRRSVQGIYSKEQLTTIVDDLWKYPFDQIADKYGFGATIRKRFSEAINRQEYKLDIRPFDDFHCVPEINAKKVLVTTGFKKLQWAKVSALKLENTFTEVYIDEIDAPDRVHKKGIFERIYDMHGFEPKDHIVIGDNPESELKAGAELGFTTVQIRKFDQPRHPNAKFSISDFHLLRKIVALH